MSAQALVQARALDLPSREAMLRRDPSVAQFWKKNGSLLTQAWQEWEEREETPTLPPADSLLDARHREAVCEAWKDPSCEQSVRELWQEVCPGVLVAQFFDPDRLAELRAYMDGVADAQIPLRPPYDSQTFGFSIRYEPDTDASLQPHTDASSVTLNVNMNLPDEDYEGSQVDFLDLVTRQVTPQIFESGVAAIHRGPVPHATHPITKGSRSNLVLWLYGESGRMPPRGASGEPRDAQERRTRSPQATGSFAPF